MKLSNIFICLLCFILIFSFFSCNYNIAGGVSLTEVKRIPSPDHKVDAVLIEADAGATTTTSTKVFIVKPNQKINIDSLNLAVFNSTIFVKGGITWKENKKLVISYKAARIFNYINVWKDQDDSNYKVNVSLNHLP